MSSTLRFFAFYAMFIVCLAESAFGQSTEKIMTYNLLNYPGSDTATRNPYFRTIIANTSPDILVVGEINGQQGVTDFLNKVMNVAVGGYAAGTFIDSYDSDNGIFFKTSKFTFVSNTAHHTDLRDINEFKLTHIASGITFRIYAVHLKASSGTSNEAQRTLEVDTLRKYTNQLPDGSDFLVCGDFNIYKSGEAAYTKLLQDNPSDDGNFIDPYSSIMTGTWNNSAYAPYHTQSPRTRTFGGGSNGGMDDRFDMILFSNAVNTAGGMQYVSGSMTAYGNDGNHFNDSINHMPNTAVSSAVANALEYASDHIPLYASFTFTSTILPITLVSFTAVQAGNTVQLDWSTASEENNAGFEVERSIDAENWTQIGFVKGMGNTVNETHYQFADRSLTSQGTYYYHLKMPDVSGVAVYSETVSVDFVLQHAPVSLQIYPMPVTDHATLTVINDEEEQVRLTLRDACSSEVLELLNTNLPCGKHEIQQDFSALAAGTYFLLLESRNGRAAYKVIIMK